MGARHFFTDQLGQGFKKKSFGAVSDGGVEADGEAIELLWSEGQEDSDREEGKAVCGERSKQECEGDVSGRAGGGRFARVSGLGGWGDGEKGGGVATPPALMKKVVEVSGPQIVGAFVGSVCRDVAYANLLAGGCRSPCRCHCCRARKC